MTAIDIIIVAQILLEAFPVSSSGHLVLIQSLLVRYAPWLVTSLPKLFLELLNTPTLIALAIFFRRELIATTRRLIQRFKQPTAHHYRWFALFTRTLTYALVANLVTTAFYGLHHMLYPTPITTLSSISLGMFAVMLGLISLRYLPQTAHRSLTLLDAITLGLAQSISLTPGISRLGTTFITAQWLGIHPRRAFQFSFLLHALLSLGLLSKTLLSHPTLPTLPLHSWLLMGAATTVSILGFKLSHYLAITNQFWKFAWYFPIPLTLIWICG